MVNVSCTLEKQCDKCTYRAVCCVIVNAPDHYSEVVVSMGTPENKMQKHRLKWQFNSTLMLCYTWRLVVDDESIHFCFVIYTFRTQYIIVCIGCNHSVPKACSVSLSNNSKAIRPRLPGRRTQFFTKNLAWREIQLKERIPINFSILNCCLITCVLTCAFM